MAWICWCAILISLISATLQEFVPEIPEHCKGLQYCEDVPNYPEEYIKQILNVNEQDTESNFVEGIDDTEGNDIPMCPTIKKVLAPKAVKDMNGNWNFIANKPIVVELCSPEALTNGCNGTVIGFYPNYESRCQQKYVYRHVLSIKNDGNTFYIKAELPSCCACVASMK